ncbi:MULTISPECIES: hypothetical protein [Chitinophagaceae]
MKDLQTSINNTIAAYFDKDMINNEDTLQSSQKMKDAIVEMTGGTLDWKNKNALFRDLYDKFYDGYIFESQVHFFYNDRCLQIYARPDTDKKAPGGFFYCFRVSIFNYFQVTKPNEEFFRVKDLRLAKNSPPSGILVDEHQDEFCDAVFDIVKRYYSSIRWLPAAILEEKVYSLGLMDGITNKTSNSRTSIVQRILCLVIINNILQ